MEKLDIFNELRQVDAKQRDFYDSLTPEEAKKFSAFVLMKWAACVDGDPDFQEYYLRSVNNNVNRDFFVLGKHPKLQWLCLTAASPGMGTVRHYYQKTKKANNTSNNKAVKFLAQLYPHFKSDELQLMASLNDISDLKNMARSMGMSDADIKKALG